MRALIQRVRKASVLIDEQEVAAIGQGMLVLVGFMEGDTAKQLNWILGKILHLRIFADDKQAMNLALGDLDAGGLLLVPQFTLGATIGSGRRPSFSQAANATLASQLFADFKTMAKAGWNSATFGVFGADMQIHLINDGPVTFWIDSETQMAFASGT